MNKQLVVIMVSGMLSFAVFAEEVSLKRDTENGKEVVASETMVGDVEDDRWQFELTPYLWLPSLKGNSTMSGNTGDLDMDFGDILDMFNYGGAFRLDAYKGKWGFKSDISMMDLGADYDSPVGRVEEDIRQWFADFTVSYEILSVPMDEGDHRELTVSPYAGFRYNYLRQETKLPAPVGKVGDTQDWIDMLIGGSVKMDLTEKLSANMEGDIGGFGIGSGSDLTWQILVGFNYEISDNMDLKIGYRHFDMDYSRGSGSNEFGMDAYFSGPITGLTIKW